MKKIIIASVISFAIGSTITYSISEKLVESQIIDVFKEVGIEINSIEDISNLKSKMEKLQELDIDGFLSLFSNYSGSQLSISNDSAIEYVEDFGKLVRDSIFDRDILPIQDTSRFPAAWTINLDSLLFHMGNLDSVPEGCSTTFMNHIPRKVRVYMAYKVPANEPGAAKEIQMVCIGANSEGVEISKASIMNLIEPCPSTCDDGSLLYAAFRRGLRLGGSID